MRARARARQQLEHGGRRDKQAVRVGQRDAERDRAVRLRLDQHVRRARPDLRRDVQPRHVHDRSRQVELRHLRRAPPHAQQVRKGRVKRPRVRRVERVGRRALRGRRDLVRALADRVRVRPRLGHVEHGEHGRRVQQRCARRATALVKRHRARERVNVGRQAKRLPRVARGHLVAVVRPRALDAPKVERRLPDLQRETALDGRAVVGVEPADKHVQRTEADVRVAQRREPVKHARTRRRRPPCTRHRRVQRAHQRRERIEHRPVPQVHVDVLDRHRRARARGAQLHVRRPRPHVDRRGRARRKLKVERVHTQDVIVPHTGAVLGRETHVERADARGHVGRVLQRRRLRRRSAGPGAAAEPLRAQRADALRVRALQRHVHVGHRHDERRRAVLGAPLHKVVELVHMADQRDAREPQRRRAAARRRARRRGRAGSAALHEARKRVEVRRAAHLLRADIHDHRVLVGVLLEKERRAPEKVLGGKHAPRRARRARAAAHATHAAQQRVAPRARRLAREVRRRALEKHARLKDAPRLAQDMPRTPDAARAEPRLVHAVARIARRDAHMQPLERRLDVRARRAGQRVLGAHVADVDGRAAEQRERARGCRARHAPVRRRRGARRRLHGRGRRSVAAWAAGAAHLVDQR